MSTPKINTPFVIWTLQRTGGTNFNKHLNLVSGHGKLPDEPFNRPREYGYVSKAWQDTKDKAALRAEMGLICAAQKNIKHCVEPVPWAVSEALATTSCAAGYAPVFLYRENPLQRLLSMEYAMRTKSWGPKTVAELEDDSAAFSEPLDVEALIAHETRANTRLNKIWRLLKRMQANPVAISYEDIYATETRIARKSLRRVFTRLGFEATVEQLEDAIRSSGDQKTRDRYTQFKGIDELQMRIDSLPPLFFSRRHRDAVASSTPR